MSTQTITDQDYETIRQCAVNGTTYKTWVEVDVNELIDRDLEQLLDLVSTRAVGSPLLADVQMRAIDFKDPEIVIFEVRGDTTAVVAEVDAARGL